jgi:hypothetical protein
MLLRQGIESFSLETRAIKCGHISASPERRGDELRSIDCRVDSMASTDDTQCHPRICSSRDSDCSETWQVEQAQDIRNYSFVLHK